MTEIIEAQALARNNAILRVASLTDNISDHLVKLIFWGNKKTSDHWIEEILGWLKSIHKIKIKLPTRGKLSAEEIYEVLADLEEYKDLYDSYAHNTEFIRSKLHNYSPPEINSAWAVIKILFDDFYKKISIHLASNDEWDKHLAKRLILNLLKGIKKAVEVKNEL